MGTFTNLPSELKIRIIRTALLLSNPGEYFVCLNNPDRDAVRVNQTPGAALKMAFNVALLNRDFLSLTIAAISFHRRYLKSRRHALREACLAVTKETIDRDYDFTAALTPGICVLAAEALGIGPGLTWATMLHPQTVTLYLSRKWTERLEPFQSFCQRAVPVQYQALITSDEKVRELKTKVFDTERELWAFIALEAGLEGDVSDHHNNPSASNTSASQSTRKDRFIERFRSPPWNVPTDELSPLQCTGDRGKELASALVLKGLSVLFIDKPETWASPVVETAVEVIKRADLTWQSASQIQDIINGLQGHRTTISDQDLHNFIAAAMTR